MPINNTIMLVVSKLLKVQIMKIYYLSLDRAKDILESKCQVRLFKLLNITIWYKEFC